MGNPKTSPSPIKGPFSKIRKGQGEILLLGTAHVSVESIKDVEKAIDWFKPDLIGVELCESRYRALFDPDRWRNLDIVKVIKEKKVYLLLSRILLQAYQKRFGDSMKTKPGEEMLKALSIAKEKSIPHALIDRDIQITLKRTQGRIGFLAKIHLLSELIAGLWINETIEEKEIEKLKQQDIFATFIENLPKRYHGIKEVILDERDLYMAIEILKAMRQTKAKRVLAVMGAAHLSGVERHIRRLSLQTIESKSQIQTDLVALPKPSPFQNAIKIALPIAIILAIFVASTDVNRLETFVQHLWTWILIKSVVVGIATLWLLPHPLSWLLAVLTAPISNFNPIFKPGFVASLTEAKFRKPLVDDFERLSDEINFKGIYKNRVLRVLLLFVVPQLASSLGTGMALYWIAKGG